jgi:hypothetical protein
MWLQINETDPTGFIEKKMIKTVHKLTKIETIFMSSVKEEYHHNKLNIFLMLLVFTKGIYENKTKHIQKYWRF